MALVSALDRLIIAEMSKKDVLLVTKPRRTIVGG